MEITLKLPNQLCERIISSQFELQTGSMNEEAISRTIELYVEATTFYTTLLAEQGPEDRKGFQAINKRSQFYQEKIKRLLARGDVQECLGGKKNSARGLDLRRSLNTAKQNAPEQAKMLVQFYAQHIKQQDSIIEQSLTRQKNTLDQRIRRRSLSKSKKHDILQEIPFISSGKNRSFVMANF